MSQENNINNGGIVNVKMVTDFIKENSTIMADLIKSTANNIKKITDVIDNSEIKSSTKKLKAFESHVGIYSRIMSTIIKSLTSDIPNGKTLSDILGAIYEEKDDNGKIKRLDRPRYTTIEAMTQMQNLIGGIFKCIETVINFDAKMNPRKLNNRIKQNMMLVSNVFHDIVKEIKRTFSTLDFGDDFKEILEMLTNEPQTIIDTVESDYKTDKDDKGNLINNKVKETTNKITKGGRVGLIDCINSLFSMISMMGAFQAPDTRKIKRTLRKVSKSLITIAKVLKNPVEFFVSNKQLWDDFGKIMSGDNSIVDTMMQFPMFTKTLYKAFPLGFIIRMKMIKKSLANLEEVLIDMKRVMLDNKDITILSDPTTHKAMTDIKKSINLYGDICGVLLSMLPTMTALRVAKKTYSKGILTLIKIFKGINTLSISISKYKLSETESNIRDLESYINSINEILPSLIILGKGFIKMWAMRSFWAIKIGLNSLFKIVKQLDKFSTSIKRYKLEDLGERLNPISNIIMSIDRMMTDMIGIGKKSLKVIFFGELIANGISSIGPILKRVKDLSKFLKKQNIEADIDRLVILADATKQISVVFKSLSNMAGPSLIITIFKDIIIKAISGIYEILDNVIFLIGYISESKIDNKNMVFLSDIFASILDICKSVIVIGILSIPTRLALKLVNGLINSFGLFIDALEKVFNKDRVDKIKDASIIVGRLDDIMEDLLSISKHIMIFALLTPVVLVAILASIIGLGALWLFITVLNFVFKGFSTISKRLLVYIRTFSRVMVILSIALLATAVAMLTIATVAVVVLKSLPYIIGYILGITIVTAVVIGLGFLMAKLSAIILVAIAGVGIMIIAMLSILILGSILNKIASFNLDKDAVINGIEAIMSGIFAVFSALATNMVISVTMARTSKKMLRHVRRAFKHIKSIAKSLNYIQSLELDKGAILAKMDSIMSCITGLSDYLKKFNGVEKTDTKESMLQQIKNARMQKRTFRQNKKMLSKVDKVLVEVNDIAEKLEFLNKFKIDDVLKNNIITNVGNMFLFIGSLSNELMKFNSKATVTPTGDSTLDQINHAKSQKKTFRQNKRMLSKVDKVLVEVNSIVEKIKFLHELNIDVNYLNKVNGNLTQIFEFISTLQDKLYNFNSKTETVENVSIVERIREAKSKKKLFKKNTKMLSKVDNVLSEVNSIAEKIKFLHELKLEESDKTTIVTNLGKVFDFIGELQTKLMEFNKPSIVVEGSNKIIRFLRRRKARKAAEAALENSAERLGKVDNVLFEVNSIAEKLEFLNKFKLDEELKSNITSNIQKLFEFIGELQVKLNDFNKLVPQEPSKGFWEAIKDSVKGNKSQSLSKTNAIILELHEIAQGLEYIGKINIKKIEKNITDNVDTIITCVDTIGQKVINGKSFNLDNAKSNVVLQFIKSINDSIASVTNLTKEQTNNAEKTLNNYGKFIEKINTVKVENLEKSTAMFQQMARFSESIEGNFEKLADVINEKLMPLLQEMKEVSNDTTKKLETGFANTSATMAATAAGPMNQSTMTAQVQRENPNMSKKDIEKMVDNRMKDQAKNQAQSLTAKIDEVIELLQGSGKIKVVPV